jgi:signal transduction histidine kinase
MHNCIEDSACRPITDVGRSLDDMLDRWLLEETPLQTHGLLQNAINSLPLQIAILNRDGDIVDWNRAWARVLAKRKPGGASAIANTNYSALVDIVGSKPVGRRIAAGISALLSGREETFRLNYCLRVLGESRSFRLMGTRFFWNGELRVAVVNEDITDACDRRQAASEFSERQISLQEEERQRIAKELHDSTAQSLAAIGLNFMVLRAQGAADPATEKIWDDTEACLSEVLKEVRTITYLLYSPRLQSEGLRLSLHRFIEGFGARTGLIIRSRISRAADRVPLPAQRSTLRIVQEALSNVHRHANATEVSVDLRMFSEWLHLAVVDNGSGICGMVGEVETEAFRPGVGLPGMRARVRELGGNLKIISSPRGTKIFAAIPIPATREVSA